MTRDAYLIGLDLGTQSVRALLADDRGTTLACARRPTPLCRLADGAAGYDPDALFATVLDLLADVAKAVPPGGAVAGIACASIGESCVLVDAAGRALAPSLVWYDRRTEEDARTVAATIGRDRLFRITGYPPDPTLSLCKLLWHRRAEPEVFARAARVLPISPWIAFRLSGVAAVDPSLAARTLCLDVARRDWSEEILQALGLDPALLPPIVPSGAALGPVRPEVLAATGLPGRPIVGVGAHDHICGGFLAGATKPGVLLDSLGTSEAVLVTADRPALTEATRDLGFIQSAAALDRRFFLVGSGLNRSGGAVEWARRTIGGETGLDALVAAAGTVPAGSGGVCFLPHLAYSSAPRRDTAARGAFVGLTDATDPAALYRAVLEGIAMEARVIADALVALPGVAAPREVRLIGGGTRNPTLLEIKASVLDRPLTVFDEPEVVALGAAVLGGVAAGLWPSFDAALGHLRLPTHRVVPDADLVAAYARLFPIYAELHGALAGVNRALSDLAG